MPQEDSFADMPFPVRGVDQSNAFGDQTPGTTIEGTNVRVFEPMTGRGRGGSRPGLAKLISTALPGEIQCLNTVVDVRSEALLDSNPLPDATPAATVEGITLLVPPVPNTVFPMFQGDNTVDPRNGGFVITGSRIVPTGGSGVQPLSAKRLPTITWADPGDIITGTPLSSTQLNATANTAGTFVYFPPSGTVLNTGDHQALGLVFYPTDTVTYRSTFATAHINVVVPVSTATLYLRESSAVAALVKPGDFFVNGAWNQKSSYAGSAARGMRTAIGTGEQSTSVVWTNTGSTQYLGHVQFLSPPLAAQVLGAGTWTLAWAATVTGAGAWQGRASLYLVNGTTGAIRTVLMAVQAIGNARSASTERSVYDATTLSLSGFTATSGDYLCLELGLAIDTGAVTSTLFTSGMTALTADNVAVTDAKSVLVAPAALTFV